ncbi:MAG: hypothetical protein CVV49_12995 [Spirochaetae bacterium HGW-Spirochaetae-5]|nr:MAG: hypothetical protein CVV49_12995 [Spirochaetae bacterium HGW-Spirochaetae-5]
MHTTVAHLSVQTGMIELRNVITNVMEKIQSNNISFELDPGSFYLIMEEALINAMHHGNRWNSGKTVNVSLQVDYSALYVIIADEGEGFSQLALTDGTESQGREGIRIIRRFCNPYWNDKGNTIYLKLPLSEERV